MPENDPLTGISWMLQNDQVSDADLAEALVRVYYTGLHRLAAALATPPSDPAGFDSPASLSQAADEVALEALAQVVAHRDRLWEHPSLRAWLGRLVLKHVDRKPSLLPQVPGYDRGESRDLSGARIGEAHAEPAGGLLEAIARMSRQERRVMLLHEVWGLEEAEIAWALHILPIPAAYYIRKMRSRLLRAAREGLAPAGPETGAGAKTNAPASPPPAVRQALERLYPAVSPPEAAQQVLSGEVRKRAEAWRARRRKTVFLRETVLIGLVVGALFFACRLGGLLPEEIIHIYQTPTPFAKEARAMRRPTPAAPFYFFYRIQYGDTLAAIARKAGVSEEAILLLNPFLHWPGKGFILDTNTLLKVPASPGQDWAAAPTPFAPGPQPLPLSMQASSQAILRRIQESRSHWRTLSATIQEYDNGPPGYLGPPLHQTLKQVWASQPGHYAMLSLPDRYPEEILSQYFLDGLYLWSGERQDELNAAFDDAYTQVFLSNFTPDPAILAQNTLKPLHLEAVAGRQALVVEESGPGGARLSRLWIDVETGVILRRALFSPSVPEVILSERAITAIAYDQAIPAGVFDPASAASRGFAHAASGRDLAPGQDDLPETEPWTKNGHTPLPFLPAPENLDPARQPLYLQWPERWDENRVIIEMEGTATLLYPRIQVFASRYTLGSLPLENVSFRACRRSPDGRRVALSVDEGRPFSPGQLTWFSLDAPQELHKISALSFGESVFAFSPDSARLAFVGCDLQENCSLYLYDLESGKRTDLGSPMVFPETLLWSPDGKMLAVVMHVSSEPPYRDLQLIDLEQRREVYFGALVEGGYFSTDESSPAWQISLPPPGESDTGCLMPEK